MKKYTWLIIIIIALVVFIIFYKPIFTFLGILPAPAEEGSACQDLKGTPGTIKDGVCVPRLAEGSKCYILGKEGAIQNGKCVVLEATQRQLEPPVNLRVRRVGGYCLPRVTVAKYPGSIWIFVGSDRMFCYYKLAK